MRFVSQLRVWDSKGFSWVFWADRVRSESILASLREKRGTCWSRYRETQISWLVYGNSQIKQSLSWTRKRLTIRHYARRSSWWETRNHSEMSGSQSHFTSSLLRKMGALSTLVGCSRAKRKQFLVSLKTGQTTQTWWTRCEQNGWTKSLNTGRRSTAKNWLTKISGMRSFFRRDVRTKKFISGISWWNGMVFKQSDTWLWMVKWQLTGSRKTQNTLLGWESLAAL